MRTKIVLILMVIVLCLVACQKGFDPSANENELLFTEVKNLNKGSHLPVEFLAKFTDESNKNTQSSDRVPNGVPTNTPNVMGFYGQISKDNPASYVHYLSLIGESEFHVYGIAITQRIKEAQSILEGKGYRFLKESQHAHRYEKDGLTITLKEYKGLVEKIEVSVPVIEKKGGL